MIQFVWHGRMIWLNMHVFCMKKIPHR